jgi:FkbM family methyltransferase
MAAYGHLNALLQKIGLQLTRFPSRADRRRIQLMRGHSITAVVDIGANSGQYGELLRRLGYAGRIVSFEPQPEVYRELSANAACDKLWSVRQQAVGEKSGQAIMNVAKNSVSSSLLEMAARHVDAAPESRVVGAIPVDCVTLTEVLRDLAGNSLMVKIDTQGFERSVLASGSGMLESVSLFEIEVSFVELYRGQALFWELDGFMSRSGFRLVSIEEGFFDQSTGELLQCDAIYARIK